MILQVFLFSWPTSYQVMIKYKNRLTHSIHPSNFIVAGFWWIQYEYTIQIWLLSLIIFISYFRCLSSVLLHICDRRVQGNILSLFFLIYVPIPRENVTCAWLISPAHIVAFPADRSKFKNVLVYIDLYLIISHFYSHGILVTVSSNCIESSICI